MNDTKVNDKNLTKASSNQCDSRTHYASESLIVGSCGSSPFRVISQLNRYHNDGKLDNITDISCNGSGSLIAILYATGFTFNDISEIILTNDELLKVMHGVYNSPIHYMIDNIISHLRLNIEKSLGSSTIPTIYKVFKDGNIKIHASYFDNNLVNIVNVPYTSNLDIITVIMNCINIELSQECFQLGGYAVDGGFYDTGPHYNVRNCDKFITVKVNRKCRSDSTLIRAMFHVSRFSSDSTMNKDDNTEIHIEDEDMEVTSESSLSVSNIVSQIKYLTV